MTGPSSSRAARSTTRSAVETKMAELPTGTVTFLFTDLEGSTRLWEQHPDAMRDALTRHDEILRAEIEQQGGVIFSEMGDGMAAAFPSAPCALHACLDAQLRLSTEAWPEAAPLKARMGLHAGDGQLRADGQYVNAPLNRCARLMAVAYGGQVVLSDAVEALAREALPPGTTLVDLGSHRLRDLANPMRVFQLAHPDLQHDFPRLRSLSQPTNLPVQLTTFIGRDAEIADVSAALAESRIVTLTGVGGVGKTRLALQAAAEVLAGFADGAWFVELAPVSDPEAVVDAIATAVGSPQSGETPVEDALVDFLRGRRALLALDNCEHVLDRVASVVTRIVRECPDVTVLCTSREGLAVPGERIYAVPALPVPDPDVTLDEATRADSVRLFGDRAAAVRSDFAITSENKDGVVAICRRLDGVPLALELAAARVTSLHPSQIAARLDERFRLLTAGRRTAVERHQTLRATIDWSYDLLATEQQTVLNRMAVFAGGCELDAAETVLAGGDIEEWEVLDLLGRLVEQSLVVADESGSRVRYRLLETIRQYAAERLANVSDTEATLARHAAHYHGVATAIGEGLQGPDQRAWELRYEAELENIRSAVSWFVGQDDADGALGLVFDLFPLKFAEGTKTIDDLAIAALDAPSARNHALGPSAMVLAAERAMRYADEAASDALLAEAHTLQAQLATPPHPVAPYVRFRMAMTVGNLDEAQRRVNEVIEHPAVHASDYLQTWALLIQASALALTGRTDASQDVFRAATEVARRTANPFCLASALNAYGWSLREDDPQAALALFDDVLAMGPSAGTFPRATTAANRFIAHARLGAVRAAIEDARQTLAALERASERNWVGGTLNHCAIGLAELDRPEWAAQLWGASEAISPVVTNPGLGWTRVAPRVEAALGREKLQECIARGNTLDKDGALALFRTALDAIEAELTEHD
jgi:predicted ATPase/class 3 adenylate cyclase